MSNRRKPVPVPIASMGDIAFLLIIFFMVASEFKQEPNYELELPESAEAKEVEHPAAASVAIDADGVIYIDGDEVAGPKDVEFAIQSLLSGTVSDVQRRVEFKCDQALTKTKFEPVLQAIAQGGGIIEAVAEPAE